MTTMPPLAPSPTVELTAVQLKRIAEAVDGYRRGGSVFVVMRVSGVPPFDVVGVTGDREEAARLAAARSNDKATYASFGPYASQEDSINRQALDQFAIVICHEPDSDDCSASFDGGRLLMTDITGLTVQMHVERGAPRQFTCGAHSSGAATGGPHPADAVFIGLAAIDKFWIPYLERIYGLEVARTKRQELLGKIKDQGKNQLHESF